MCTDWNGLKLALAMMLAAAAGCGGGGAVEERSRPGVAVSGDDCPGHRRSIQTREGVRVDSIPLSGAIATIPEYHDCQRFLPVKGDDYTGPLAAIWVASKAKLVHLAGTPLRVADEAQAIPPEPRDSPVREGRRTARVQPLAVILSFDKPYLPLKMAQGLNCLYLRTNAASPTGWDAVIAPISTPNACDLGMTDLPNNDTLPLRAFKIPPSLNPAEDIPEVARWDHTSEGRNEGLYYIGIGCGGAWCEIGRYPRDEKHEPIVAGISAKDLREEHMSRKPVPPPTAGMTEREGIRVREVKGWHDVQRLALRNAANKLYASVTGAAFPQPELDRVNSVTAFQDQWMPSAYLRLDGRYKGKHLDLRKGVTSVELCYGTTADCLIPKGVECVPARSEQDKGWWARLTPPEHDESGDDESKKVKFRCVTRHPDGGANITIKRGAVRWRWSETDESLWIRCADGCCTLD